jgi:hypothetical protein
MDGRLVADEHREPGVLMAYLETETSLVVGSRRGDIAHWERRDRAPQAGVLPDFVSGHRAGATG